jgi:hypothetical protein
MSNRKYFGLDTETPMGKIAVIATNEESSEVKTFEDILTFLGKHRYRGSIFWTFNLQFDVEHILKSTGDIDFLRELYDHGTQRPGLEYHDHFIQYIPRKLFKICKNKRCVTFYDIAQFYRGASLEKASQQYLGIGKLKNVDSKRLGEEVNYYEEHLNETLEYCQRDAELTLKLAQKIEEAFTLRGISFRNPISMAKISEVYVNDHYRYPKVLSVHNQMHQMARHCFHGGLFWTLKRGYFRQSLYCFDINSAYPSVMSTLPHWGNGEFKEVFEPTGAQFGWYGCEFDCCWVPQFQYQKQFFTQQMDGYEAIEVIFNNKRKIYPSGMRKQWITAAEYWWMKKNGFKCNFGYGYEWIQTKNKYVSPFEWMAAMYKERKLIMKHDKSGMLQYSLKILLNGLYGKTCQYKHGEGRFTNFFYASYITAETRLKVAEIAMRHPKETIEIATDSVTLTKDISDELKITDYLGDWSRTEYTEGLFIGSGMRQTWTLGGGYVTYARGLTDKRDYDLRGDMENNRDSAELTFTRKRPIHLGEMLLHHYKLSFADLGVFMDIKKNLRVNTDTKSIWERDYETFGDFLDSEPMGGEPLKNEYK